MALSVGVRLIDTANWWAGHRAIEKAVREGKVKAIGLSNFPEKLVREAVDTMELKPQIRAMDRGEEGRYFHPNYEWMGWFFTNPID